MIDMNLYKNTVENFINPFPNCVEVVRELNEYYNVYITFFLFLMLIILYLWIINIKLDMILVLIIEFVI